MLNRKEKRRLIIEMAELLDEAVATGQFPAEMSAKMIDVVRRADEGAYLDHKGRKLHAALASGKIVLERTITKE